jgi:predicted nucleic acid-binding protein
VEAAVDGGYTSQLFLSAVTMGELQSSVELTRQQDPDRAAEIELWVDQLSDSSQVLPMDTRCFRDWARLMCGTSDRLIEDGMIAATARVHGFIVATRNEHDFKQLDVRIFNPFTASQ